MANKGEENFARDLGKLEGMCSQTFAMLQAHVARMDRVEEDLKETAQDYRRRFREADKRTSILEKKLYAIGVISAAVWGGVLIYFRKIFS